MTAVIAGFKAELSNSGARQLRQLMVKETAVTEAGLLTVLCSSPHLGRRERPLECNVINIFLLPPSQMQNKNH
jgi:hypothetical protein